jgi:proteasome lid subunit RPN8/RPN11
VSVGETESLVVPRAYLDAMIEQARAAVPAEACGLLAGAGGRAVQIYKIPNADPSIYRYNMEPRAQLAAMLDMEAHDWDLLAIYHSHTHTPAYPSPTDIGQALYPDAYYAILSLQDDEHPELRAFCIVDNAVREVGVTLGE